MPNGLTISRLLSETFESGCCLQSRLILLSKKNTLSFFNPFKYAAPILTLDFDNLAMRLLVNETETSTGTITTSYCSLSSFINLLRYIGLNIFFLLKTKKPVDKFIFNKARIIKGTYY